MEYQGQHGHATNHVDQYGNPVATPAATGVAGAPGVAGAGAGTGGQFQPAREGHKTGGILHRSGSSSSSSSEDDGMGGRRKKGIKEKIKEKLPGGRKGQQQPMASSGTYGPPAVPAGMTGTGAHRTTATGGTYVQPGHAGMTGTGAHGTTATGGTYGQPGAPAGVTGTGPHGTMATGEKKGVKDKIKEKLPGGYKDGQQTVPTAGAHGQQGHVGMTGTGIHGNASTGGAYGQQGHTGVTGTGALGRTAGTGGAYGQQGHTGVTGTGAHPTNGTGEKKGIMDKIKEKLPGQH